jgi:hypothetical protein
LAQRFQRRNVVARQRQLLEINVRDERIERQAQRQAAQQRRMGPPGTQSLPAEDFAQEDERRQREEDQKGRIFRGAGAEQGAREEQVPPPAAMAVLRDEPGEHEQQPEVERVGQRTGGGHPDRQAEGQEEAGRDA